MMLLLNYSDHHRDSACVKSLTPCQDCFPGRCMNVVFTDDQENLKLKGN